MKLLTTALIALLVGCTGQPQHRSASDSAICRHQYSEYDPSFSIRGDPAIIHGRLIQLESAYEFRPCDEEEIYLVDGSFAVLDNLDQYFSVHSTDPTSPIYVRFHGLEIECDQGFPRRYANAVVIMELITKNNSVPPNCT